MKHHKIKLTPEAKIRPGDFYVHYGDYFFVHPGDKTVGKNVSDLSRSIYRIVPDCFLVRHVSSGDDWPSDAECKLFRRIGDEHWGDCAQVESDVWLPDYYKISKYNTVQNLANTDILTYPEDYVDGIVEDPAEVAWKNRGSIIANCITSKKDYFKAGFAAGKGEE